MKHHCHCGFKKRHQLAKGKKLGVLGASLMILHLLYHVAECLILPAVFMAWSGRPVETAEAAEETVMAEDIIATEIVEAKNPETSEQTELDTEETSKPEFLFLSQPHLYTDFFETLH